jgi:hypothetical protein
VILSVPLILHMRRFLLRCSDRAVTIYQSVCFPIYRIRKVRRRDYLIFDRGRLAYLNAETRSFTEPNQRECRPLTAISTQLTGADHAGARWNPASMSSAAFNVARAS